MKVCVEIQTSFIILQYLNEVLFIAIHEEVSWANVMAQLSPYEDIFEGAVLILSSPLTKGGL